MGPWSRKSECKGGESMPVGWGEVGGGGGARNDNHRQYTECNSLWNLFCLSHIERNYDLALVTMMD